MNGIFFLILGPSGVGKGTFVSQIKEEWKTNPSFLFPITATTRTPRDGERNGVDYYFLDKDNFESDIKSNSFLEYAVVHGKNYYGLPKKQVFNALESGIHVIRELDLQGLWNLQEIIPKENLFSIFISPPNIGILEKRIRGRSTLPEEEIQRRLETAKNEIQHAKECDRILLSEEGKIQQGVINLKNVILTEIQKQACRA